MNAYLSEACQQLARIATALEAMIDYDTRKAEVNVAGRQLEADPRRLHYEVPGCPLGSDPVGWAEVQALIIPRMRFEYEGLPESAPKRFLTIVAFAGCPESLAMTEPAFEALVPYVRTLVGINGWAVRGWPFHFEETVLPAWYAVWQESLLR